MSAPEESYKALFSYGHMRATYIDADFSSSDFLHIAHFVRHEYLNDLRNALTSNQDIFSQQPNTLLQSQLSPVSRQCLWELHSGIMIRLLENITGLANLLPDTHCKHSGLNIFTHNNHDSALLLSICLSSGNAVLKKLGGNNKDHLSSANIFHVSYWQHSASLRDKTP